MTSQDPIVVVGAGQCGLKAIETLRRAKYSGPLYLIGDEPHPPYQRPPLSKAFLKGEMEQERLLLTSESYFSEHGVTTVFGHKVISIDTGSRIAEIENGQRLCYSNLLLATGSRARIPDMPGIDLEGVYSLRTLDDTTRLSAAVSSGVAKIAIIGGGYVGLEVAASMRAQGHSVTIVEGADRLLKRVVCPEISNFFEDLHKRHGVTILKGTTPKRLRGETRVTAVELTNGDIVECDLVLIAVGSTPDVEFAAKAGLEIENGIKVDRLCRTSAPNVYAAGDCVSFPSDRYGRSIRLESVQNAIDQGKAAAHAMLGEAVSYDPVPWFWSDQYNVKLQIAGLSESYDRIEVEPGSQEESFAVKYFKDDRMLCVDAVNHPRAFLQTRRHLETESS